MSVSPAAEPSPPRGSLFSQQQTRVCQHFQVEGRTQLASPAPCLVPSPFSHLSELPSLDLCNRCVPSLSLLLSKPITVVQFFTTVSNILSLHSPLSLCTQVRGLFIHGTELYLNHTYAAKQPHRNPRNHSFSCVCVTGLNDCS